VSLPPPPHPYFVFDVPFRRPFRRPPPSKGPTAGKTVMVVNINPSTADFDETQQGQ